MMLQTIIDYLSITSNGELVFFIVCFVNVHVCLYIFIFDIFSSFFFFYFVLSFVFFCVRFYFFCLDFVLYLVYDFIINK